MTRYVRLTGALTIAAVLLVAGCSPTTEVAPAEPSASENAYGGFPVDPPASDEVVLTIEGDRTIDFTYSELQSLATVEIEIIEPFVQLPQRFTGVPLATLLEEAEVPAGAKVETIALNDYRYTDTVTQWTGNGAILAVFRDDELIPMDQGGPIRIVFAADSPAFGTLDAWNWSLRTISVVDGE